MSTLVAQTAEVRWGYTMDDIDRFARRAFNRTRRNSLFDQSDHYSAAWFGVTHCLFSTNDEQPSPHDLIEAGVKRIQLEATANRQFYGLNGTGETSPRFNLFWRSDRPATSRKQHRGGREDFTDRIAEREALPMVLGVLNTNLYEAVITLAAYDNMGQAARALGISDKAFEHRIKRARALMIAAWFSPEHPPNLGNGYGDTCRAGHSRAENSYRNIRGANVCRICQRNAGRRWEARQRDAVTVVLDD